METLVRILFGIIFVVGSFTIAILLMSWGWQDARERGLSVGWAMLAAFLAVFAFPLGLMAWWLIRPSRPDRFATKTMPWPGNASVPTRKLTPQNNKGCCEVGAIAATSAAPMVEQARSDV